jgi:5-methylcytosine-specific restriction enzyme subunit McrC
LIKPLGNYVSADNQDQNHFDEAGRVRLRPDIVWKVHGSAVAVIDAKYKAEKPAGYPNADLYQLLAYCTVLGLRSGHLVYVKGNGKPVRHVVRRSGIEIFCHAIDLDQVSVVKWFGPTDRRECRPRRVVS